MTELEALRRLCLSSSRACKTIFRAGFETDAGIANILTDAPELRGILRTAERLSVAEVNSLLAPLIDSDAPAPTPSQNEIATVRTVAFLG